MEKTISFPVVFKTLLLENLFEHDRSRIINPSSLIFQLFNPVCRLRSRLNPSFNDHDSRCILMQSGKVLLSEPRRMELRIVPRRTALSTRLVWIMQLGQRVSSLRRGCLPHAPRSFIHLLLQGRGYTWTPTLGAIPTQMNQILGLVHECSRYFIGLADHCPAVVPIEMFWYCILTLGSHTFLLPHLPEWWPFGVRQMVIELGCVVDGDFIWTARRLLVHHINRSLPFMGQFVFL